MSSIKYQPHIDGLRALAVISVVLFHALPEYRWGGFVGVDIFFVISGYLISKILLNDLSLERFSISQFYVRRIRRIFPSLILVLLFCLLVGSCILMSDEYQSLAKEAMAGIVFVSNILFMHQVGYFDVVAETKPLLHLWSLGVEEQFYIFWPLMLFGVYRLGLKSAERLILTLIAASLLLSSYQTNYHPEIAFYSPLTRFWELLVGALLACQQTLNRPSVMIFQSKKIGNNVEASVGVVLLLLAFVLVDKASNFPGFWALLPTIGASLIIKSGSDAWFNQYVLASKGMVFIGLISYPLYLWHWPILSFLHILDGKTPSLTWRISAVSLSFILAWVSYNYVEKFIRSRESRVIVVLLVVVMMAIGLAAYKIYEKNGYKYHLFTTTEQAEAFVSTKQWLSVQRRNCQARYPQEALCFTNTPYDQKERVIFLGDSHADVISAGVLKNHPNIYATSFMAFGCPPFLGVNRISNHQVNSCDGHTRQVLDIIKNVPNQTVVLSARFAMYETGKGFMLPKQSLDEPDVHIQLSDIEGFDKKANYSQVFATGLRNTINALEQQHKSIVFVYQTPELGFDPRACLSRPLRGPALNECKISRQSVDNRQASYRKVVGDVLKDHPNIITVDPLDELCDKSYCYGGKGRVIFYKDDDHLSVVGSALISPSLVNAILKAQVN